MKSISSGSPDSAQSAAFHALAERLGQRRQSIVEDWKARAEADPALARVSTLSRREFLDHVPRILAIFEAEICALADAAPGGGSRESGPRQMRKHGLNRWQQGFSISEVVRDWNHLRSSIMASLGSEPASHATSAATAVAQGILGDLIAEGINLSVAEYERLRQEEARSHTLDLQDTIASLSKILAHQQRSLRDSTHDLRGNLGLLLQLSKIASQGAPDAEQLNAALLSGLQQSLQILDDLRYHASLESGDETLEIRVFDASALLRECERAYGLAAKRLGLSFNAEGPDALEVRGDELKVSRIVQNLIANAINHTLNGEIALRWGLSEDATRWRLEARNSGVIRRRARFAPMPRQIAKASEAEPTPIEGPADTSTSRTMDGEGAGEAAEPRADAANGDPSDGIGLSIAKRLCDMLGAKLHLEFQPEGDGATAIVEFPVSPP